MGKLRATSSRASEAQHKVAYVSRSALRVRLRADQQALCHIPAATAGRNVANVATLLTDVFKIIGAGWVIKGLLQRGTLEEIWHEALRFQSGI